MTEIAPPDTTDSQEIRDRARGTAGHYSGQEYDALTAESPATVAVGSGNGGTGLDPDRPAGGADDSAAASVPEDAGRRGHVDQRTGAVHGSGASAGGGTAGDDPDSDSAGGSGTERGG